MKLYDWVITCLIIIGSIALVFGSIKMKVGDPVSVILVLIGAASVYGSEKILKLLKKEINEKNILIIKFIGLLVACIGIFKILQII